jgi:superfamily II DNA or RNA helicase
MTRLMLAEIRDEGVVLVPEPKAKGVFRVFQRGPKADLSNLHQDDKRLTYALARVRSLDTLKTESVVRPESLTLSHALVAQIEDVFAEPLGLPSSVSGLSFGAKLQGTLGSPDARLGWWWDSNGRVTTVPRTGAILFPDNPTRRMRIPNAVYSAITLAESFDPTAPLEQHWRALAEFRVLLGEAEGTALDPFLDGLKIVTVARVGLEVTDPKDARFGPVPFASQADEPLVSGAELLGFQADVATQGTQATYRLEGGAFAVIDPSAGLVLNVISDAMQGDAEARQNFIDDASRLIAEAVEKQFQDSGEINKNMSPEAAVELVERTVDEGWTDTSSWSDRVTGVGVATMAAAEIDAGSGLPWLPPSISVTLGEMLGAIDDDEVEDAMLALRRGLLEGAQVVALSVGDIPVRSEVIEALVRRQAMRSEPAAIAGEPADAYLPIVHANLHGLDFFVDRVPRNGEGADLPDAVTATLRGYQIKSFDWQVRAWTSGLPGVLNADEQGLGKTLQTLSFLAWLNDQMRSGLVAPAPVLIVAPTSLLRNWQAEIDLHLDSDTLGPVHRLYGTALLRWRQETGRDIGDGAEHLDLSTLKDKQGVIITTYQTLANYAVSFAGLRCATAVFDEMQFIKNPRTQRAQAVKTVNTAFFIGLTGTPIENKTQDLWSILDILSPGALGSLTEFNRVFAKPSPQRLSQLQRALFQETADRPALCLRRTKNDADPTIPSKVRLMYPQTMPPAQALRYDEARAKTGGILQVLQHLRRISAHPGLIEGELAGDFIGASARTKATMDILRFIKSKGEKALVFVENRDIQAWFIEIVNLEFDLSAMLINGDTSIDDRQDITQRFQRARSDDDGFDVLVLGPRAAGTGLTLTAANHVIHLTRWWNPAVEEQCNDRTHRIGQTRPVTVHIPMAVHPDLGPASFDCLLHRLVTRKIGLASDVLSGADVNEGDLRLLYDASVLGRVVDEVPREFSLADGVPDRKDLDLEFLAENVVKIFSDKWPASILVAAGTGIEMHSEFIEAGTEHVVLIDSNVVPDSKDGTVPTSRVYDDRLWPDFIVPY